MRFIKYLGWKLKEFTHAWNTLFLNLIICFSNETLLWRHFIENIVMLCALLINSEDQINPFLNMLWIVKISKFLYFILFVFVLHIIYEQSILHAINMRAWMRPWWQNHITHNSLVLSSHEVLFEILKYDGGIEKLGNQFIIALVFVEDHFKEGVNLGEHSIWVVKSALELNVSWSEWFDSNHESKTHCSVWISKLQIKWLGSINCERVFFDHFFVVLF